MSGFLQHPLLNQDFEYSMSSALYIEEPLDPIDQDISCPWMSLDFTQFTDSGAGALNNQSFPESFTPYPQYTMNVPNQGLLLAPPNQPASSYYVTPPSPACISLPSQPPYSNLNSPQWTSTGYDCDDSSSASAPSVQSGMNQWSEGDSPIHSASPLAPPETNSGWAKKQRRKQRENIYQDSRYNSACSSIIEIMAGTKVQLDSIDPVGAMSGASPEAPDIPQSAQTELGVFIHEQDVDIQKWLISGANRRVVSDANIRAAVTRRGPVQRMEMYKCFWCKNLMTTKGNLSNHIRSHLGFHISFCNECSFSAVTPRIPARHASTHREFGALRQRGRGNM